VLIAEPDPADLRLRTVLEHGAEDGVHAILLGEWAYGATCRVDAHGTVVMAAGAVVAHLAGARLDTLTEYEARAQLPQPPAILGALIRGALERHHSTGPGPVPVGPAAGEAALAEGLRPRIWVRVFGRLAFEVDGQERSIKLGRKDAKHLLSLLIVHRDGLTDDAICEALFPGKQFRSVPHRLYAATSAINGAWSALAIPDCGICVLLRCFLQFQVLDADLMWGPVPVRRVKTRPIIEQLDVPRNITYRCLPCRVHRAIDTLLLERREE